MLRQNPGYWMIRSVKQADKERTLDGLYGAREEAIELLKRCQQQVADIDSAIRVVEGLPVEVVGHDGGTGTDDGFVTPLSPLTTTELIVEILEDTGKNWSIEDLHGEMTRRGWRTAAENRMNAIRAALQRLAADGDIVRVGRGVYHRVENAPTPGAQLLNAFAKTVELMERAE
jgi:hypothetical protein